MRPAILRIPLTFLAACAAAGLPALPAPETPETCPAIDRPAAAPSLGIRAFIDPATGKLRPPTAEERRLASAARERAGQTREVVLPDGTRIVELDDAFLMSVVATKRPDGTFRYRCVTQQPAAGAEAK